MLDLGLLAAAVIAFLVLFGKGVWLKFFNPKIPQDRVPDLMIQLLRDGLGRITGTKLQFIVNITGTYEREIFFRHNGFSCTIQVEFIEKSGRMRWVVSDKEKREEGERPFSESKEGMADIAQFFGIPVEKSRAVLAKL